VGFPCFFSLFSLPVVTLCTTAVSGSNSLLTVTLTNDRPILSLDRGAPYEQHSKGQAGINIWPWAPDGATDWPLIAMWVWVCLWSAQVHTSSRRHGSNNGSWVKISVLGSMSSKSFPGDEFWIYFSASSVHLFLHRFYLNLFLSWSVMSLYFDFRCMMFIWLFQVTDQPTHFAASNFIIFACFLVGFNPILFDERKTALGSVFTIIIIRGLLCVYCGSHLLCVFQYIRSVFPWNCVYQFLYIVSITGKFLSKSQRWQQSG
jgi:hypothetical protein